MHRHSRINGEQSLVRIDVGDASIDGDLCLSATARGIVVFAHGTGSGRFSPRNRFVATALQRDGFATLLLDLLTRDEEFIDSSGGSLRFDIGLLADRLVAVLDWLGRQHETKRLPIGLFGASTGAGAALVAARDRPDRVAAVVSRGGRPDLAGPALRFVRAPTLLIVGGSDGPVIECNRDALAQIGARLDARMIVKQLVVVRGATHLFEEPGALETVARFASTWFAMHASANANAPERRHER